MAARRRLVALLMIGFAGFVTPALAGVVPIARLSELHVQGQHGQTPINESLSFDEFGPYDNQISTSVGNEGSNRVGGKAEQTSNVDISLPGRIHVSASMHAQTSVDLVPND